MRRQKLLKLLNAYNPSDRKEKEMKDKLTGFVKKVSNCFDNLYPEGHITASAWIVDKKTRKVGLVHHGYMDRWLQPGGHSDGNSDTPQEALREAQEEFGSEGLSLISEDIFDIDVHEIEEDKKRGLGKHLHYDVRFLVNGDSSIDPKVSNESNEVRWVNLDSVENLNSEEAIFRMVEKTKLLLAK